MPNSARLGSLVIAGVLLAACGGSDTSTEAAPTEARATSGLRLVSAIDAQATFDDAPDDLVILDVRTPEEFAEGHVDGAIMLDFYRDDFASEVANLDPDVPYVIYCRSGNRSGQTIALMEGLGFQDVQNVDGGVIALQGSGLPLVAGG